MNTSTYTLSTQAMSLLNSLETIADSGNRKAEKLLQKAFKRIKRCNCKAQQELPAVLVAETTAIDPRNTPVVAEMIANLEHLLAAYHADQHLLMQDTLQGRR
jgi:hypothetical protein